METKIDWGFVITMIALVAIVGHVLYAAYWPKGWPELNPSKLPKISFWRLRMPLWRRRLK
jgi:hypothetical protein